MPLLDPLFDEFINCIKSGDVNIIEDFFIRHQLSSDAHDELLLRQKCLVFREAAGNGLTDASLLLLNKANTELKESLLKACEYEALTLASCYGYIETVKILLAAVKEQGLMAQALSAQNYEGFKYSFTFAPDPSVRIELLLSAYHLNDNFKTYREMLSFTARPEFYHQEVQQKLRAMAQQDNQNTFFRTPTQRQLEPEKTANNFSLDSIRTTMETNNNALS